MDRFWSKVKVGAADECWEWQAGLDSDGYGRIQFDGKRQGAHRFSWILHNTDIPQGMCICHRCDNPACVNPNHLFLGTQVDNIYDMVSKNRNYLPPKATHCVQGHEYTPENTKMNNNKRKCRTCANAGHRRRYARKKVAS